MLGPTVLSIGRRDKLFHLFFAEFRTALVSLGVLTAESRAKHARVTLRGNSRPNIKAAFVRPNNPRRENQYSITLVLPSRGSTNPFWKEARKCYAKIKDHLCLRSAMCSN